MLNALPSEYSSSSLQSNDAAVGEFRAVQRLAPGLGNHDLRVLLALAGEPQGLTPEQIRERSGLGLDLLRATLPTLAHHGYLSGEEIPGAKSVFGKVPKRYRLARIGGAR